MQETKVLLQQSRERLVITSVGSSQNVVRLLTFWGFSRVAHDLSSYDTTKYKVSIVPSQSGNMRFHLGETIKVNWQAPVLHSRRDWIGIYRVSGFVSVPSYLR
jgi:phosphatidylethanolamine N-methyltransferase